MRCASSSEPGGLYRRYISPFRRKKVSPAAAPESLPVRHFIYVIPPKDGFLHRVIRLGVFWWEGCIGLLRLSGKVRGQVKEPALLADLVGGHNPLKYRTRCRPPQ